MMKNLLEIDPCIFNLGLDIPFTPGGFIIHQPSLEEIGLIGGQKPLFTGCELLRITVDDLKANSKDSLDNMMNFDILMQVISVSPSNLKQAIECVYSLFQIIFPDYEVKWNAPFNITLTNGNQKGEINRKNFDCFVDVLTQMFVLKKITGNDYNPQDPMAQRIVKQLRAREKRLAELRGEAGKMSGFIFDRYISVLAVGLQKDKNQLKKYTVYQLFDEFDRYQAKVAYDMYAAAKMAGATNIEEVEMWMGDLHSHSK